MADRAGSIAQVSSRTEAGSGDKRVSRFTRRIWRREPDHQKWPRTLFSRAALPGARPARRHRADPDQREVGAPGTSWARNEAIGRSKGGLSTKIHALVDALGNPMHIGKRRAGPLFPSREKGRGARPRVYSRQRIGQMVREVAAAAGIAKRLYPHLLRHTMATRLLAQGMAITDVQRFLGHEDIGTTRLYAETSVAMLRRKFDQVTVPAGRVLVRDIAATRGEVVAAFASDLLSGDRRRLVSTTGA
jgi:integrase